MDELQISNRAVLTGVPAERPVFSHESRGQRFFRFPLEVSRLSGTMDKINIIAREELLPALEPDGADMLHVAGELRSFNNRSGVGSRLVITVYARELFFVQEGQWENNIELRGTLCKAPNLRTTPMGREICDLMLAVNRRYNRSDYLPCIAWGYNARRAALWDVGTRLQLLGRAQSRRYIKNVEGEPVERTAFEVSVIELEELED